MQTRLPPRSKEERRQGQRRQADDHRRELRNLFKQQSESPQPRLRTLNDIGQVAWRPATQLPSAQPRIHVSPFEHERDGLETPIPQIIQTPDDVVVLPGYHLDRACRKE